MLQKVKLLIEDEEAMPLQSPRWLMFFSGVRKYGMYQGRKPDKVWGETLMVLLCMLGL